MRGSGRGRKEDWEMCSAEVDKVKKKVNDIQGMERRRNWKMEVREK